MIIIYGISHRHGELNLPMLSPGFNNRIHQLWQIWHRLGADLSVNTDVQTRVTCAAQCVKGKGKRTRYTPEPVVQRSEAVQRDSQPIQPRINGLNHAFSGQVPTAGLNRTVQIVLPDASDNFDPVFS